MSTITPLPLIQRNKVEVTVAILQSTFTFSHRLYNQSRRINGEKFLSNSELAYEARLLNTMHDAYNAMECIEKLYAIENPIGEEWKKDV